MAKNWKEAASLILATRINFTANKIPLKSAEITKLKNEPSQKSTDFNILLLRRNAGSSFMPSSYVFPGGMIAPSDYSKDWRQLFEHLGFSISNFDTNLAYLPPIFQNTQTLEMPKTIALRITAIRETFEECGILLCRSKYVKEFTSWASYLSGSEVLKWQTKVHEDPSEFIHMCKILECVPDIWSMHLWSNWLTPAVSSKRFDTIFFIALIDQCPPAYLDNVEVDDMKWCATSNVVQQRFVLPPPQFYEICRLNNFEKLQDLAKFSIKRAKLGCGRWMPIQVKTSDGVVFLLPAIKMYQDLPAHIQDALQKHGLSSIDAVLLCSESKACRLFDLPKEVFENVKLAAAKRSTRTGLVSALQAHVSLGTFHQKLSTGCDILDEFLQGGLVQRGITEITGESGAGKTQLCLQLSLSVQYQEMHGGLNAGTVFISTEKIFPSRRLQELIHTFQKKNTVKPNVNWGDNIYLEHIPDVSSLVKCVTRSLPNLLSRKRIGLIVIDSIAGVFRTDYDQKDLVQRAHDMQIIGKQLHKLAREYSLVVVCVNQVACVPIDTTDNDLKKPQTVAALNVSWGNLVTTRLQLFREDVGTDNREPSSILRTMEVVFSPHLPRSMCKFMVISGGVFGIR